MLIPGVSGAGLEGFSGDPRESSSGRSCRSRVASARSARMRATSGKSLFTETLYVAQIIRYVIVSRIASERPLRPQAIPKSSYFTYAWRLGQGPDLTPQTCLSCLRTLPQERYVGFTAFLTESPCGCKLWRFQKRLHNGLFALRREFP